MTYRYCSPTGLWTISFDRGHARALVSRSGRGVKDTHAH